MSQLKLLRSWILSVGYVFLYAPILYLIVFSFNDSKVSGQWLGFTWKWYLELWHNRELIQSLFNSLNIAAITATGAVILGIMASYTTIRIRNFKARKILNTMITIPMIMPDIITGIGLLLTFIALESLIGWPAERGVLTVIIAHITMTTAYAFLMIQARLADVDMSLEEAAMDLGAQPLKVFFTITLPIMTPTLLAAWLLAFALSLDDLVIAGFLAGPGATTLPMVIFSSIKLGISPDINALATLLVLVISLGVLASAFWIRHKEKHQRLIDE
jgi:putrescine transport system permease protein